MEGQKRQSTSIDTKREIGIFEGKVVGINPTKRELEDILGTEIKEEPKYNIEKEGVKGIRVSIWLKDVNADEHTVHNISFFLENRKRINKTGDKYQYINSVGTTTWGLVEKKGADLPTWFTNFVDKNKAVGAAKEYRVAYVGEEELVNFIKNWLDFNYWSETTNILLDIEKILKGNVSELTNEMGGDKDRTVLAMATVRSTVKEVDGNPTTVNYQSVYNKAFAPGYTFKVFKGLEFTPEKIKRIQEKTNAKLETFERFVLSVVDKEYGCKDNYYLGIKKPFDPEEFITSGDTVLSEDDAGY